MLLGAILSACTSPDDTIGLSGPAYQPPKGISDDNLPRSAASLFSVSYESAFKAQLEISKTGRDPTEDQQRIFRQMAADGFGVVKANCQDFFKSGGEHQKWILFTRDAVGAGGTLATGILALASAGTLPLAIVSLSTTTIFSGLDVYTKNFLFGADNISSVATLVNKALDTNQAAVFQSNDLSDWTFESARDRVAYQQDICKPAQIRQLAVDAIATGRIKSAVDGTDSEAGTATLDNTATALIGRVVGMPAGASPGNGPLAALCWAARETPSPAQQSLINDALPIATYPNGPASAPVNWAAVKGQVALACNALSAKAQSAIKSQIDAWKALPEVNTAVPQGVGRGAIGQPNLLMSTQLPSNAGRGSPRHYSIKVAQ
jgi:hypothetical protein